MENNITIFYNIQTGEIKIVASGEQNLSAFGEDENSNIDLDFIIVPSTELPKGQSHMYEVIGKQLVRLENPREIPSNPDENDIANRIEGLEKTIDAMLGVTE